MHISSVVCSPQRTSSGGEFGLAGFVGRVVEVGDHLDPRPLRQGDGLDEVVGALPVEVPVVDPDQGRSSSRRGGSALRRKSLPSQCMCGMTADQVRVLVDRSASRSPRSSASPAGISRLGPAEEARSRGGSDHPARDLLVDRPLGEVEADRGGVGLGLAALVVVDLQQDVGPGGQVAADARRARRWGRLPGAQPPRPPDGMRPNPPKTL